MKLLLSILLAFPAICSAQGFGTQGTGFSLNVSDVVNEAILEGDIPVATGTHTTNNDDVADSAHDADILTNAVDISTTAQAALAAQASANAAQATANAAVEKAGDTMTGNLTVEGVVTGERIALSDGGFGAILRVTRDNASGNFPGALELRSSNGTPGSPSAVANGSYLGRWDSFGYDDAGYERGTIIIPAATEAWTAINHGAQMRFYITKNGETAQTQVFVMNANGQNDSLQDIDMNGNDIVGAGLVDGRDVGSDLVKVEGDTMTGPLKVEADIDAANNVVFNRDNANQFSPGFLRWETSNGSPGSPVDVINNTHIAIKQYTAWEGASYDIGAKEEIITRQAWTPTAHGSAHKFKVVPNNSTSLVEFLRLDGAGETVDVYRDMDLVSASIIMDASETVDGVDVSAHAADNNAHHSPTVDTNTNALTECNAGEYYSGTGTCDTISGGAHFTLDDSIVTSAKIADGAVTTAKLDRAYVQLGGDEMTGSLNIRSAGAIAAVVESETWAGVILGRVSTNASPAVYQSKKARGTIATPLAIENGDALGDTLAMGHDGAGYFTGSRIRSQATENWTGASRGTELSVSTVKDGTNFLNESILIDSSADVTFSDDIIIAGLVDGVDVSAHAADGSAHHAPVDISAKYDKAGGNITGNAYVMNASLEQRAEGVTGKRLLISEYNLGGGGPIVRSLRKAGSVASSGAGSAITNGMSLRTDDVWGYDGVSNAQSAKIVSAANQAWSAGNHGTKITFYRAKNGETTPTAAFQMAGGGINYSFVKLNMQNNNIEAVGTVDGVDISGLETTVSGKVNKAGDTLTGPLLAADGLFTAPSYSFASNTGAGMFVMPGGNVRLQKTSNDPLLELQDSGIVIHKNILGVQSIDMSGDITMDAFQQVDGVDVSAHAADASAHHAAVDISGKVSKTGDTMSGDLDMDSNGVLNASAVIIGTNTLFDGQAFFGFLGDTNQTSRMMLIRRDDSAGAPEIQYRKARGTKDTPTAVVDGDNLSQFRVLAYDGNSDEVGGRIQFIVDGVVADEQLPTKLVIEVNEGLGGADTPALEILPSLNLDMLTHDIQNVGSVDGVDVSAHAGDASAHHAEFVLADGDVTSAKILDGAVTTAKLDRLYVESAGGTMTGELALADGLKFTTNGLYNNPTIRLASDPSGANIYASGNTMTLALNDADTLPTAHFSSSGFNVKAHVRADGGSLGSPGLSFYNDTNTGVWDGNGDDLTLIAGGVSRLRVGQYGNIFNQSLSMATNDITSVGAYASVSDQFDAISASTDSLASDIATIESNDWVTSAKIADGEVTSAKLAAGLDASYLAHTTSNDDSADSTHSADILTNAVDISTTGVAVEAAQATADAAVARAGDTMTGLLSVNQDGINTSVEATNSAGNAGGILSLRHSQGSIASPTASQNGNNLGRVLFKGHNGSFYKESAKIVGGASENYTGSVSGSRIDFYTTPNGTNAEAFALRVKNDGRLDTRGNDIIDVGLYSSVSDQFDAISTSTDTIAGDLSTHDGLTGSSAHGATSANTASQIVVRDGSGNFTAGTITATEFSGGGSGLTGVAAQSIGISTHSVEGEVTTTSLTFIETFTSTWTAITSAYEITWSAEVTNTIKDKGVEFQIMIDGDVANEFSSHTYFPANDGAYAAIGGNFITDRVAGDFGIQMRIHALTANTAKIKRARVKIKQVVVVN